tara:strand:+ start:347 stop:496 length:150 start_codon:yes stop_codon:yes gene_type:complete
MASSDGRVDRDDWNGGFHVGWKAGQKAGLFIGGLLGFFLGMVAMSWIIG